MVDSLNEKKILFSYQGGILRRWYFILIIACFAFIFWQINSFAFLLWLASPFLIFYKKDEDRILGALVLISLSFCILFLFLVADKLAEISAIYVYYFLVLFLAQRLAEARKDPAAFDLTEVKIIPALDITPEIRSGRPADMPVAVSVRPKISEKKNNTSVTMVNALVIILYLLIFGASWPNQQNYSRFILLAFVLFLVNSAPLFKNYMARFFTFIFKKSGVDQKNVFLVCIINSSIIISYFLLYGFSLPNPANYHRFIVLFFILFIINSMVFFDIANDQYSD